MSFLSSIFGGGNNTVQPINYNPGGFSSSGLSSSVSGGNVNLTQSPALSSSIGNLSSTFGNEANAFGKLASTVQPGFSQLRRAGLNQINTQQAATTSNLRDTLAQRRVLGSSFANASLSQSDAEFAQQKANFVAQSYLQEVNTSQQLIQQQYAAATQQFSTGINQMNFEAGIAANLTTSNNQINAQVAQANSQIAEFNAQQAAASAAGVGKFIGTAAGAIIGGVVGGPAGALAGASIGGSAFGGSSSGSGINYNSLPTSWSSPFSSPYGTTADAGGGGIGSGGYNFLDAQAGA